MPKIHREALLPYSQQMMFDLVNDVTCYSEFLPWCHATEVLEQRDDFMRASIMIKKMGISKSFTTENHLFSPEKIIMNLVNGPFKYLKGEWRFMDIKNQGQDLGCKIIMDLEFEFLPGLMNLPFKKIFEPAADSMLQAFVDRARNIYGHGLKQ